MRMLCDNTKSFRPLSHYGLARKARIDRIISEKFHAPAINAASSELLEEKTNKSDAEFQDWDVTRSYVYILDRMSSFVNTSNRHNDATPTYWETRANPAELEKQIISGNLKEPLETDVITIWGKVFPRFMEAQMELEFLEIKLREFGVVLKMDWLSSNGAQIDYKGKKVKIRMPNGKEIMIKGQRQTQKFLNIIQAKKLLRKDSKAYLAYVAGTKREAPMPTCKMEKVVWNEKCEESFQELKRSWVIALVLALPDGKGKASVVADALSSKERLKMLTTPEELVRELEEMEIEVKSLGQECQAIQSLIETSQGRRVDLGIREPPARKTTSMDQTRTVVLRRVRNAREFRRLFVRQPRQKDRDDAFYVRDEVLKINESLKTELEKEREIIRTWTNSGKTTQNLLSSGNWKEGLGYGEYKNDKGTEEIKPVVKQKPKLKPVKFVTVKSENEKSEVKEELTSDKLKQEKTAEVNIGLMTKKQLKHKLEDVKNANKVKSPRKNRNGKEGVNKSNDYKPVPDAPRKTCHNCGSSNHLASFCRKNKNINSLPSKSGVKSQYVRYKPQNTCFHYGSLWHSIYTCKEYHSLYYDYYQIKPSLKKVSIVPSSVNSDSKSDSGNRKNILVLDSGCSGHMTGNKALLSDFVEKAGPSVSYGDGNIGKTLGYGNINLGNVIIKEVALVSGLKTIC
ncbi:hypothetical protein AgCh_039411 [Apium graveolens]